MNEDKENRNTVNMMWGGLGSNSIRSQSWYKWKNNVIVYKKNYIKIKWYFDYNCKGILGLNLIIFKFVLVYYKKTKTIS